MREARSLHADLRVIAALGQFRLMTNAIGGTPPEVYFSLGKSYLAAAEVEGRARIGRPMEFARTKMPGFEQAM